MVAVPSDLLPHVPCCVSMCLVDCPHHNGAKHARHLLLEDQRLSEAKGYSNSDSVLSLKKIELFWPYFMHSY